MGFIKRIDQFHTTKLGYAAFAVVELILLYIFVLIAIDTGSTFAYIISFALIIDIIRSVVMFGVLLSGRWPAA